MGSYWEQNETMIDLYMKTKFKAIIIISDEFRVHKNIEENK